MSNDEANNNRIKHQFSTEKKYINPKSQRQQNFRRDTAHLILTRTSGPRAQMFVLMRQVANLIGIEANPILVCINILVLCGFIIICKFEKGNVLDLTSFRVAETPNCVKI